MGIFLAVIGFGWATAGLVNIALGVSLLLAPFRFDPPAHDEILDAGPATFVDAAELDAGRLGLIWAGIVILSISGMVLTSGAGRTACPACREQIARDATVCRFCGFTVPKPPQITCVRCGTVYDADVSGCGHCWLAKPRVSA